MIKTLAGLPKYKQFRMLMLIMLSWMPLCLWAQSEADKLVVVNEISYLGNKITKERIISRELMITAGDKLTYSELEKRLEKSRENLMNTSLFNFVKYETISAGGTPDELNVVFNFTERWYVWPWPILEFADRNFNAWWTENRDLSRVSYGVALKWENFRGRRETLAVTAKFGYNELYGFEYTIPYLNKKETLGLGVGAFYGRTKEVAVVNLDNKLEYYKNDDDYVLDGVVSFLSLIYRKKIYNTHTLQLGYNITSFDDTLNVINPQYSIDGKTELQYLSLSYKYKSDHRDQKAYPLQGYYFDFEIVKRGFGVLDNGGLDVFYVLTTFRTFSKLGKRWYFSSGLNSKFSNDATQPFFMDEAIGYGRDIVRGYEYYVVHGKNFGIFKSNLKFALLPTREFNINFIKSQKFSEVHYAFYLNAFFDMGFVDNFNPQPELGNTLENSLLIGYGIGLDFVTYYDLVFRFEYSFNRLNEHGLFLHFTAPI
jgi:outer membrane protein assembly factor BamA